MRKLCVLLSRAQSQHNAIEKFTRHHFVHDNTILYTAYCINMITFTRDGGNERICVTIEKPHRSQRRALHSILFTIKLLLYCRYYQTFYLTAVVYNIMLILCFYVFDCSDFQSVDRDLLVSLHYW